MEIEELLSNNQKSTNKLKPAISKNKNNNEISLASRKKKAL